MQSTEIVLLKPVNKSLPWAPSQLFGVDGGGGAAELSSLYSAHQALIADTARQNAAVRIHTIGSSGD